MPILFHGPEARNRAVQKAMEKGRLVSEFTHGSGSSAVKITEGVIGDEGLKIAHSRAIVALSMLPGVGSKRPSLVVGPLDDVKSPEAPDALLKTVEEISDKPLYLVLWAHHLDGVIGTIRSRCMLEWCPPIAATPKPFAWLDREVEPLVQALIRRDPVAILASLDSTDEKWADLVHAALPKLAEAVIGEEGPAVAELWSQLRPILDGNGGDAVAVDAFLPSMEVE